MADNIVDFGEIDKTFYLQYGRAMANWAQLENSMAGVFSRLTKIEGRMSGDIFYSARSFLGRADMLHACVPHARTLPAGREFLTRSINRAMGYAGFRNRLAHNMHTLYLGNDETGGKRASRKIISGVEGPDHDAREIENASLNFSYLGALLMVSIGRRKLLREPELSLATLALLPTDAAASQTSQTTVAMRISEIASLPD